MLALGAATRHCTFPPPNLLKESSNSHPSKVGVPSKSLRIWRRFETHPAGLLQWRPVTEVDDRSRIHHRFPK